MSVISKQKVCNNCRDEFVGIDEDRPSGKFGLCPDCYDSKIEEILTHIRKSAYGEGDGIDLQWGLGWRRNYGYVIHGGNEGKYYTEGHSHSGYATTGWHDREASIYTEAEMKAHIAKHFRKFRNALDSITDEVNIMRS